jgi:hypothetical protein
MKQYVVLSSLIVLGLFIFDIIAGNGEHSLANTLQQVWIEGIDARTYRP